jgi:hypothetical protein
VTLLFSRSLWPLVGAFVVRGLKEFGEPIRKALIMDLAPENRKAAMFGLYYLGASGHCHHRFEGRDACRFGIAPCRWEISLAARNPETTRGFAPYKNRGGVKMRPYYLVRDVVVSFAALGGAWTWMIHSNANLLVAFGFGALGTLWFAWRGRDLGVQSAP